MAGGGLLPVGCWLAGALLAVAFPSARWFPWLLDSWGGRFPVGCYRLLLDCRRGALLAVAGVAARLARALPVGCWLLVADADSPARLIGCSIGALLIVDSPVLDGGGCFPVGCWFLWLFDSLVWLGFRVRAWILLAFPVWLPRGLMFWWLLVGASWLAACGCRSARLIGWLSWSGDWRALSWLLLDCLAVSWLSRRFRLDCLAV